MREVGSAVDPLSCRDTNSLELQDGRSRPFTVLSRLRGSSEQVLLHTAYFCDMFAALLYAR